MEGVEVYFYSFLPDALGGKSGFNTEGKSFQYPLRGRLRMFQNRMLRTIFRPKRNEMTGGWTKLHNEELHNLYSSPSVIRIIKSRRMR
jgi:hypothetical protein